MIKVVIILVDIKTKRREKMEKKFEISEDNNIDLSEEKYEPTMVVGMRNEERFYSCKPNCYHLTGDYEDSFAAIRCSYFDEELDNDYSNEIIRPCYSCIKKLFDL